MTETASNEENRFEFGYEVMGPILAECCHTLQEFLANDKPGPEHAVALYCARGGLTIRRALALYRSKTGQPVSVDEDDLMISRLAASRLALVTNAESARPLLDLEFDLQSKGGLEHWVYIYDRIATGEMPPKDSPRPKTGASSGRKKGGVPNMEWGKERS